MSKYTNILFTDIETVPQFQHYSDLGERDRDVFEKKFSKLIIEHAKGISNSPNLVPEVAFEDQLEHYKEILYQQNAALHAEFCKIVSIGFGYITVNEARQPELRIKVNVSDDEVILLNEFKKMADNKMFNYLCGHNFFDFDGPILCRRSVINGIKIPYLLDPTDKKSWDLCWKDTMKIWSYGEWNAKISLDRMCYALGVETPKGEMDGSEVKDYFYGLTRPPEELPFGKYDKKEERFKAIGKYQAGDIVALANCFLRLMNEPVIASQNIRYV